MALRIDCPRGVEVLGSIANDQQAAILSQDALQFLATLHRTFNERRISLLNARVERQKQIDAGAFPTFLSETANVRADDAWRGPKPGPGITDRRVEITGPVDRKMVINALNSGATQFMADFEDSSAPTWQQMLSGQVNMRDALNRSISFDAPNGKHYQLNKEVATLLVRPRGWHLDEKHVIIDGRPCSGSIFDFAIFFFHCAKISVEAGQGPYFYLPKMESHLEARLWNDIFNMAQDTLGVPRGTIRATVLIETILAAFEMEEIIYELREHSAGLNCGRWDYIFSMIKKFWKHPGMVLPDRKNVGMDVPFMDAYVRLVIKTCHRRGVHAMGGMAAQIPIKENPAANDAAMEKVRQDKLREATYGHDGTWVAHPALIPIAKKVFDEVMPGPNQMHVRREEEITPIELINTKLEGGCPVTEGGMRANISVALSYMENWLRGVGCVPFNNLMEDAATAEISRSQVWQWIHHKTPITMEDSKQQPVTSDLVLRIIDEEAGKLKSSPELNRAKEILIDMTVKKQDQFVDFLTSACYADILEPEAKKRATRSRM